jgi:hypothetical protein
MRRTSIRSRQVSSASFANRLAIDPIAFPCTLCDKIALRLASWRAATTSPGRASREMARSDAGPSDTLGRPSSSRNTTRLADIGRHDLALFDFCMIADSFSRYSNVVFVSLPLVFIKRRNLGTHSNGSRFSDLRRLPNRRSRN